MTTPTHWRSLAELSRDIHASTLTPVDLAEELLDRIDRIDTRLHAFRPVARARVLDAARAAEMSLRAGEDRGALHGIPFAAKDIIDVQGLPMTAGSNALVDNVPEHDATVVRLLRRAGMVLLGKTNTVQFALGAPGINRQQGTPHNPWSAEHHVPGGSSSGSGVAVAAGLVPMALGSDTGGSVRMPASLCGTVGLKTTVGQVSRAGVFPLSSTLDSVGPMTRTVEDCALVYQEMHGPDPADPSTAGATQQDVLSKLKRGVRGLRIAVAESFFWDDCDAEVALAVRAACDVFSNLGARVESIDFPQAQRAVDANPRFLISSVEAFLAHKRWFDGRFDDYDETIRFRMDEGASAPAAAYLEALEATRALARETQVALEDIDALIAPTTKHVARPLSEVDATTESYVQWNGAYARNTVIANLLGLCAVSVPCGFTSAGLPIGLMVHAKPRAEAMALRVAHAYEQAARWCDRRPVLDWAVGV